MTKAKITHYTKSEEVHIKYGESYTNYIYNEECKKLTETLIGILNEGYDVEIHKEEYTPAHIRSQKEFQK